MFIFGRLAFSKTKFRPKDPASLPSLNEIRSVVQQAKRVAHRSATSRAAFRQLEQRLDQVTSDKGTVATHAEHSPVAAE